MLTTILYRLKSDSRQCVVHVDYRHLADDDPVENKADAVDQWQQVMDEHSPMSWLDCELDAVILPTK